MTSHSYLVALAYLAFAIAVYAFEARRIRHVGADVITAFTVLLMLQCCAAGIFIYALLPYAGVDGYTGVYAFDRILRSADLVSALFVLCLTIGFTMFFYLGCAVGGEALQRLWPAISRQKTLQMSVRGERLAAVLAMGMALTLYSFYLMGDNWLARYAQLILYRAFEGDVERDALNANAFALTQAWSWLTVVAVFCASVGRWRRWLLPVCILGLVVFVLLGVSRRAVFIPVLMGYLTLVLYSGRWWIRWILVISLPVLVLVAFGKNALAALANGGAIEDVASSYGSWASALLRAACDIGITIVESVGTLQFLDLEPRFGLDHLASMLQMFPEKSLGLDFDFPERIVRISTEAFDDPNAQDIPPGLMGQMWLDFRMFGPVVWGLLFGLQVSVVQFLFKRTRRTRESSAVFVLATFVIALPLNSGSFDFTFSIDIFALAAVLLYCVRFRAQPVTQAKMTTAICRRAAQGATR